MLHANPTPPPIRAKVIKDGNSVAVRLPASLGLKAGEVVDIDVRRVAAWPPGFFDLEPSPDFPMPERTAPGAFLKPVCASRATRSRPRTG